MSILKFDTNIPVQIALKFDEGKLTEGRFGDQVMYSLAEPPDTVVYFSTVVAAKINELGIVKGEMFCVCKREVKNGKGRSIQWDVWRPESEELTPKLVQSLQVVNGRGSNGNGRPNGSVQNSVQGAADGRLLAPRGSATGMTQPPHSNGKDTRSPNGNAPDAYDQHMAQYNAQHNQPPAPPAGRQLAPAGTQPPTKIPMDEAVVEAVRMVQQAMKATGEQWSDGARQDLAATILIGAQREGWLTCWKRGAA